MESSHGLFIEQKDIETFNKNAVRALLSRVFSGFLNAWTPTKPLRIGYKNY